MFYIVMYGSQSTMINTNRLSDKIKQQFSGNGNGTFGRRCPQIINYFSTIKIFS